MAGHRHSFVARFDSEFSAGFPSSSAITHDAVMMFEANVRALFHAVSKLPELNRVMVHAATADSARLTWIVDTYVRPRFDQIVALWTEAKALGATHLDADPVVLYYCLIGAASLMYVNAPEARLLSGVDETAVAITHARVQSHADTLVAMLLGPTPTSAAHRHARTSTRTHQVKKHPNSYTKGT